MIKKKILIALFACAVISLQANATEYSGLSYEGQSATIGRALSFGTSINEKNTITDCQSVGNGAYTGGAIANYSPGGVDIFNLIFTSNNSTYVDDGGGVIFSDSVNAAIEVHDGTFHLVQGSSLNGSTLNMGSGTTLNLFLKHSI